MFSSIRRYTVERGSVEELIRRAEEGFVPLVRRMSGIRGYYLIKSRQNVLIAMSVFETAEQALASNEIAANLVTNNLLDTKTGPPDVTVGDVLISEVK